ncbi:MAG: hypothetical protein Q9183_004052 [Haloplaca sp. 2 TL-2023]
MSIVQNPKKPLNSNDSYICAIEAMYHWADESWGEEMYNQSDHSETIRGLQISYHAIPDRPINIFGKHVILAILFALNTMDRMNVFAETIIDMKQHGKLFGIMNIGRPNPTRPGVDAGGDGTRTNRSTAAIAKRRGHSNTMGVNNVKPSKTITETGVGLFGSIYITYQRFGHTVPCKLLFSTALDGIAYAATDDHGDTWPFSTTYDWSKRMMYQTVEVNTGHGGSLWTADLIKRVARLVPQQMFEDNECGEVRFRVEVLERERIGTGSFQVLEFQRERERGRGGLRE